MAQYFECALRVAWPNSYASPAPKRHQVLTDRPHGDWSRGLRSVTRLPWIPSQPCPIAIKLGGSTEECSCQGRTGS